MPARHHVHVAGHRLPRRAGRRVADRERARGQRVARRVARVSFGLAYLITTSLHITIGEQVPKIWAIQTAERASLLVARPLDLFTRIFNPFIVVLNGASNAILRVMGVKTSGGLQEGESPEELKVLIQQSLTGGKLDEGEAGMLTGVFHLHEQEARQVMTPAPAVVTVDLSEDVETALRRCVSFGHTRLVVTEDENHDRVKGIVHANALAQRLMSDGPEATIDGLVREAPIVPETKALDDLLADLKRQRTSLAVVIDEYGRTAGIVTVEDIIEDPGAGLLHPLGPPLLDQAQQGVDLTHLGPGQGVVQQLGGVGADGRALGGGHPDQAVQVTHGVDALVGREVFGVS